MRAKDEVLQVMDDLRVAGVDFLTIGQYLQPTKKHAAIDRFWTPDEFKALETIAYAKGFLMVSREPADALLASCRRGFREAESRALGEAMITPNAFRSRYHALMEAHPGFTDIYPEGLPLDLLDSLCAFVDFDERILVQAGVDATSAAFLLTAGIPASAAPLLSFDKTEDAFAALGLSEEYYPLGSGSGDPIVIEVLTGRVLMLLHDEGMRAVYANETIAQFAETLCLMVEHWDMKQPQAFLEALRAIDPPAAEKSTMWHSEAVSYAACNAAENANT